MSFCRIRQFLTVAVALFFVSSSASSIPCVAPDNGIGTPDLPPGCADGYVGFMRIEGGLPPGTTIDIDVRWHNYFNEVEVAGGALGGERQIFDGFLEMQMVGTGALAGFSRLIQMPVACETHSAPRVPAQPVQSFDADVFSLNGEVLFDPDFDLLRVRAGSILAMPGPGHTILTEQGADFNVDSFFDIEYRIEFQGAAGSVLGGLAGITQRIDPFRAGEPVAFPGLPCFEPDNGSGTADLPPLCLPGYDGHLTISDGFPVGTAIEMEALLGQFFNRVEFAGGGLGGHRQMFEGVLTLPMTGTGFLGGFNRFIQMPVVCETFSAPRTPFDPVQSFDQEFWRISGNVLGDPDFSTLSISGGSIIGSQSLGHTTLTEQPTGGWAVDSFFDICYELTFAGAPGSILDGFAGTDSDCNLFYLGLLPTGLPEIGAVATGLRLLPSRPNPIRNAAEISYQLPGRGGVATLHVYDVAGRRVRTLLDGFVAGGPGTTRWDGRTDGGGLATAGIYFYRLQTPYGARTQKATLLR